MVPGRRVLRTPSPLQEECPKFQGGRLASTSVVSPYGGPVTTGKPGIHLAPSRFGFPQSPLPALCRQATSCAWRSRLRKIPERRSGCSRGHAEVRSGGHPWATLAAQTVTSRNRSGVLGRPWRPRWPKGGPRGSTEPNGDARQTLRAVWAGGHVCQKAYATLHIWNIQSRGENVSRIGARQTLRAV